MQKSPLSISDCFGQDEREIIGEHIFNWLHEVEECKDLSWGTFKSLLAYALIEHLSPIKARYQEITAEPEYLDKILSEGADRATELGDVTMCNVYQAMGFYPRRR